GERANIVFPRPPLAAANVRLGEMIEHEALAGEPRDAFSGRRQMPPVYKEIERQVEFRQNAKPFKHVGPYQKAVVRFGLHDVPNADKLRTRGKLRKPR